MSLRLSSIFAVVLEDLRLGIGLERFGGVLPVHVAEGDDVLARHFAQIARPLPAHADAGDIELLIGRDAARPDADATRGDVEAQGRGGGRLEEFTTLKHGEKDLR